ncbi:TonB-dependent receptor [Emcibacter nanhaiensis]|uniref:TonB-dependent receptor n=1 Tax=Emcibacter nanhaiensis TaxID=1505037 RepID=A0A501PB13_9PROT|nr:TonB-dependent receptor [Emcibacter nanhaiensis]TPD57378.1 TonB-dependent receptor [Emcibacter nanhaiensis]
MTIVKNSVSRIVLAGVLSSVPLATAAYAADEGSAVTLEEIVVTAQKRSQNIQDVPIAISAVTANMLKERGINDVSKLSNMTPNVTLDAGTPFAGSSNVLSAYVRGIGQNDFAFNLDPGVGVYVDGVYYARTVGANMDLGDVERIEILKGPQGTLFGRNTIGGAISIVTREPGDEFFVTGEMITGSYNRLDAKASVDLPISDTIRSSFSFSTKSRDGFVERIPYVDEEFGSYVTDGNQFRMVDKMETSQTEGGEDTWSLRGKIVAEASDRLKITLSGDYNYENQEGLANTLLAVPNSDQLPFGPTANNFTTIYNTCISSTAAELAAAIPAPFDPGFTNLSLVCGERGVAASAINPLGRTNVTSPIASVNVDDDPYNNRLIYDERFITDDIDKSYASGPSFSWMQSWGGALTLDYDLTDKMALKSITSYRELHWQAGMDLDGAPIEILELSFEMNQWQFSQEFQLNGTAMDDKLDYVVGVYYFKEKGDLHDLVAFPAGLLQVDGNNLLETEAMAAFAHLNYRFNDQFSITLGGRYTDESKKFQGFQSDLNGFNYKIGGIPINALIGIPCDDAGPLPPTDMCDFAALVGFPDQDNVLRYHPPGEFTQDFTDFSPRIGVEYKPNEDMMLYASYSKGFKTGSWTTRYSNPVTVEQAAPGFKPEKADSYEIGLKSELADRTILLNMAGFYTKYKNIQLNQQEGVSPTLRNAGDAEIYGFEIESQFVLSAEFSVNANVGYTHAKYTRVEDGVNAGGHLPKTPEWKFNINPRYDHDLGDGKGFVLFSLDYTYTSTLFNDTENTPQLERGDVNMLNGFVSYRPESEAWEVAAGVNNILDERYLVTGSANLASGQVYGTYNRPTEWFLKLSFKM